MVFAPSSTEIYPAGFAAFVEPGHIATVFEGAIRPRHFRGVATVVLKLFNIVRPDIAFFGQKDFQQVVVIRRLVEDFNLPVQIVACPIVREADGLAKSSRNVYLNAEDRKAALLLSRSLQRAEEMAQAGEGDAQKLVEEMRKTFEAEPRVRLDYAAIVSPNTLEPVAQVIPGSVALVAARLGAVRLIDNLIFGPPGSTPELKIQLAFSTQPTSQAKQRNCQAWKASPCACSKLRSCRCSLRLPVAWISKWSFSQSGVGPSGSATRIIVATSLFPSTRNFT